MGRRSKNPMDNREDAIGGYEVKPLSAKGPTSFESHHAGFKSLPRAITKGGTMETILRWLVKRLLHGYHIQADGQEKRQATKRRNKLLRDAERKMSAYGQGYPLIDESALRQAPLPYPPTLGGKP